LRCESLGEFLRDETRVPHETLEQHPVLRGMRDEGADALTWLLGYQTIAAGYDAVATAVNASGFCREEVSEAKIDQIATTYRNDLTALTEDGYALGRHLPVAPRFANASQAFGAVWCLNGSRFGARMLHTIAKRKFGPSVEPYLTGLQKQLPKSAEGAAGILAVSQPAQEYRVDRVAACDGAVKTFAHFGLVADVIWGGGR
jgi:heme oxygenase